MTDGRQRIKKKRGFDLLELLDQSCLYIRILHSVAFFLFTSEQFVGNLSVGKCTLLQTVIVIGDITIILYWSNLCTIPYWCR